jgi:outer membrane protein
MHLLILNSVAGEFNFGLGVVSFRTNHYRGSDQDIDYHFPLPYFYYQGENFEADSAMINGKLLDTRFLSIQLTMSAGPGVESESNIARSGMPELDWTFGIGPMAILHIIRSQRFDIQIESAIRREFKTDFSFTKAIGTSRVTYLTFKLKPATVTDWSAELAIGQLHGDEDLHGYFYNVDSKHATADRLQFTATGGKSGKTYLFYLKKRFGSFLFFPFVRYDDLEDVVFKESPLVKQNKYLIVGLGLFHLWF